MKSFKNDLAPLGFYFDLFPTPLFQIPVLPLPMRIDKITNGEATLFILPNIIELNKLCEELNIQVNYDNFFSIGVQNLVNYARITYKEIKKKNLDPSKIMLWFKESIKISKKKMDLTNDFTFLISEYLKIYSVFKKNQLDFMDEKYKIELINYCDKVIEYFQKIINNNSFKIIEKDSQIDSQIYLVKKKKNYPNIIPIRVKDLITLKKKKMAFVPYLIYEDLLDCFTYNRKLLTEKIETPYNYLKWNENNIISELPDEKENSLKNFSFQDINIEIML